MRTDIVTASQWLVSKLLRRGFLLSIDGLQGPILSRTAVRDAVNSTLAKMPEAEVTVWRYNPAGPEYFTKAGQFRYIASAHYSDNVDDLSPWMVDTMSQYYVLLMQAETWSPM